MTKYIDKGHSVDVIYLDFTKAFDSVPRNRLLKKMEAYGITVMTLESIRDFLSDRTFQVKLVIDYLNCDSCLLESLRNMLSDDYCSSFI